MLGIRLKAVVWGFVAASGAAFAALIVLGFYADLPEVTGNMSREGAQQFFDTFMQDPRVRRIARIVDFLASALGGYVAARLAKPAPLVNAGCVGVVAIILDVFMWEALTLQQIDPVSTILMLPAALIGGFFAPYEKARQISPPESSH